METQDHLLLTDKEDQEGCVKYDPKRRNPTTGDFSDLAFEQGKTSQVMDKKKKSDPKDFAELTH